MSTRWDIEAIKSNVKRYTGEMETDLSGALLDTLAVQQTAKCAAVGVECFRLWHEVRANGGVRLECFADKLESRQQDRHAEKNNERSEPKK